MTMIGVLGGIGPGATAEFYDKLIRRLQEKNLIKSNVDFPQIIINSIPAPELIYDNISETDLDSYRKGLQELDGLHVDFILMVCNTIHLYYDVLQREIRAPILDLREETRNELAKREIKSVLVIGTPSTIKQGLYKFENINYFEPDESELEQLSKSIFDFNRGFETDKCVDYVRNVCKKYLSLGADIVILGCTEFALMLDKENIPRINTIDVLVNATVDRFLSLKYISGKEITR
ncbi:MAG: amino acid racemase [Candidatus Aenigmatarchaeota archaeon]